MQKTGQIDRTVDTEFQDEHTKFKTCVSLLTGGVDIRILTHFSMSNQSCRIFSLELFCLNGHPLRCEMHSRVNSSTLLRFLLRTRPIASRRNARPCRKRVKRTWMLCGVRHLLGLVSYFRFDPPLSHASSHETRFCVTYAHAHFQTTPA